MDPMVSKVLLIINLVKKEAKKNIYVVGIVLLVLIPLTF